MEEDASEGVDEDASDCVDEDASEGVNEVVNDVWMKMPVMV